MMRALLTGGLLLVALGLSAQHRVGAAAGAGGRFSNGPGLVAPTARQSSVHAWRLRQPLPGTRVPAPLVQPQANTKSPAFDFARAKPHLAFFCRLELDIEEATRIPVRFRLGEVRTWQQELTRRE